MTCFRVRKYYVRILIFDTWLVSVQTVPHCGSQVSRDLVIYFQEPRCCSLRSNNRAASVPIDVPEKRMTSISCLHLSPHLSFRTTSAAAPCRILYTVILPPLQYFCETTDQVHFALNYPFISPMAQLSPLAVFGAPVSDHAVHVLLLIENSMPMVEHWPDLQHNILPGVLGAIRLANPRTDVCRATGYIAAFSHDFKGANFLGDYW